jgi:hypothetical protein
VEAKGGENREEKKGDRIGGGQIEEGRIYASEQFRCATITEIV